MIRALSGHGEVARKEVKAVARAGAPAGTRRIRGESEEAGQMGTVPRRMRKDSQNMGTTAIVVYDLDQGTYFWTIRKLARS